MCKTKNTNNIAYNESILINCRNIWFQEFWSQHHKCSFNDSVNATTKKCSGLESLKNYEQEGLVPYVCKYFFLNNFSEMRISPISSLNFENKKYVTSFQIKSIKITAFYFLTKHFIFEKNYEMGFNVF